MSLRDKLAGEIDDPVLAQALERFKASVDAWSDAAMNRPRTVMTAARYSWRLALTWSLGCVLAVGSVTGFVAERHRRQELARIEAQKAVAQKASQAQADAQPAAAVNVRAKESAGAAVNNSTEDQALLAAVDSDVSRQIPTAMEPLAQLMDDSGTTNNGTR